jgi:hypothetical protein
MFLEPGIIVRVRCFFQDLCGLEPNLDISIPDLCVLYAMMMVISMLVLSTVPSPMIMILASIGRYNSVLPS